MHQLNIILKNNEYPLFIKQGLMDSVDRMLQKNKNYSNIFILSQQSVINNIKCSFISKYPIIIVEENEASKSVYTVERAVNQLLKLGCNRDSLLIGLGGGTITDVTGFIASVFMRGIDHVFIPTTLLGMIDSSIGGKTGINSNYGRNVIGTFKQPEAIYIDPLFLKTLSKNNIISGFAEIIKYGLIADKNLYKIISSNFRSLIDLQDLNQIESIIYKCCEHKIDYVVQDEFDQGKRMVLNFGHTIGHALESFFNYQKISHGEAVYYGMIAAIFISKKHGFLKEDIFNQVYDFLFDIPKISLKDVNSDKVFDYLQYDKKKINNKNHFILLNDIGKASIVDNVISQDMKDAINFIVNYEYSCN